MDDDGTQFLSLAFVVFLATVVHLSLQWREAVAARREAELGRREAELKNLKNQVNPHFLLNTLNNIYALTTFDTEKARLAIMELSQLLRYVLYDNQADKVPLYKEADFLRSYVELMRIRLPESVEIRVELDVPRTDEPTVAPLIFISLVENAFKHGVSPTLPSFIHIHLFVKEGVICFPAGTVISPNGRTTSRQGASACSKCPSVWNWLTRAAMFGSMARLTTDRLIIQRFGLMLSWSNCLIYWNHE